MKIHVDTLNSRIETDNPDLLRALYELYSFKIPGAEYSSAYKRRQWDGKTHFISTEDTQTLDTDWGAVTDAADDDGKVVTTSHTFPKGITLYGMYDFVELNSGACIVYVAPRHDYIQRTRAAAI